MGCDGDGPLNFDETIRADNTQKIQDSLLYSIFNAEAVKIKRTRNQATLYSGLDLFGNNYHEDPLLKT